MAGKKTFVAGEILTASDVNSFLMDQSVMVFDNATARNTAIPSPSEGMVTYLKDTDALEKYTTTWEPVNTFGILQVVSTTKTNTFTTTGTTFTDVTGLSVSITPTSATSKIFVIANFTLGSNIGVGNAYARLARGSTAIFIGDASSSRARVGAQYVPPNNDSGGSVTLSGLDSPGTTSATIYKVQIAQDRTGAVYINRSHANADSNIGFTASATITAWEVAA